MSGTSGRGEPDVMSVVLPARNEQDVIDGQLEALARQSYDGPWEVVLADNGSTDSTVERARGWETRLPGLLIVDAGGDQGVGHARNVGTKASSGALVAYCDADDVVGERWVESLVRAFAEHDLVTGPIELAQLNRRHQYGWRGSAGSQRPTRWLSFLPEAIGANIAVRRSVFDEVGGFRNDPTGQDCDFCWRVQLGGHPLAFAPGAVVHRRVPDRASCHLRRQFAYARGEPRLFREFRAHGMPRSSTGAAAAKLVLVAAGAPLALHPAWRFRWCDAAANRLGRLAGSWQQRVLYL